MKSKEEIINDSIKLETPPGDYNLLEIHCFLALKQLLVMFHNKQITTENASKTKQLILADYEKRCKEFDFQQSMFREYIENVNKTSDLRIKLRKILRGEAEENKEITEARLCETICIMTSILQTVFKEEF